MFLRDGKERWVEKGKINRKKTNKNGEQKGRIIKREVEEKNKTNKWITKGDKVAKISRNKKRRKIATGTKRLQEQNRMKELK